MTPDQVETMLALLRWIALATVLQCIHAIFWSKP